MTFDVPIGFSALPLTLGDKEQVISLFCKPVSGNYWATHPQWGVPGCQGEPVWAASAPQGARFLIPSPPSRGTSYAGSQARCFSRQRTICLQREACGRPTASSLPVEVDTDPRPGSQLLLGARAQVPGHGKPHSPCHLF